ncbi:hypothetical protein AMK59_8696 [Oryctes borbonicus]|uniref:Uncharacterized protein n=1 Tax=Oryctes borbonicus TaxID=1629725 RepID=A0A0T6AYB8_9SCAR|nr:hypothetical protein AMK59_8696 [Oryctes borbonicus]
MFIIVLVHFAILHLACSISRHPILIVVSYDAFRYDYLNPNLTPNLFRLRQKGTFAEYIYNVFPTKTFPNHFTIATGMYTETHGVVGNSFYDPTLKEVVQIGEAMFTQNKEIIPIWTLNELAGDDRHSAVLMWPGGMASYKNVKPTYFLNWSHEYDMFKRVDKAMEWLMDSKKPANLVMVYIEEPDYYSHIYGPDSQKVYERIKVLDKLTQYLEEQLRKYKLENSATIIHLSDHGMSSVKAKDIVNITQFLQPNTYTLAETTPCMHVIPKEGILQPYFDLINAFWLVGYEKSIYDSLKKASETLKTFDVYRKSDLPDRWHFKNNPRTPPIFLMSKENYGFQDILEAAEHYKEIEHITVTPESVFGVHGFDPEMQKMHPFFMVRGPNIRKNYMIKPFNFVDLYNFFTEILRIKSVPNNSTTPIYKEILTQSTFNGVSSIILITVAGVLLSLLLIGCAVAITVLLIKRQQSMRTTAALNKRFPQTFQQSIEAQHLLEAEEA